MYTFFLRDSTVAREACTFLRLTGYSARPKKAHARGRNGISYHDGWDIRTSASSTAVNAVLEQIGWE